MRSDMAVNEMSGAARAEPTTRPCINLGKKAFRNDGEQPAVRPSVATRGQQYHTLPRNTTSSTRP